MRRLLIALLVGLSAACDLFGPKLATIEVIPGDSLLVAGAEIQLQVIGRDEGGEEVDVDQAKLKWSTFGNSVALGLGGFIRAVGFGESTVTATHGIITGSSVFRVNPKLNLRSKAAYINQVIQNPDKRPVPLIAGRQGLFRVFLVVDEDHYHMSAPKLRVELLQKETSLLDTILTQGFDSMRRKLDEGELHFSYNLLVPGELIVKDLRARLTYDPTNELDGVDGAEEVSFTVIDLPQFTQMVIPFISTRYSAGAVNEWVDRFTFESDIAFDLRTFLPVSPHKSTIIRHETVLTDLDLRKGKDWGRWLREVAVLRHVEKRLDAYYYGANDLPGVSGIRGLGYVGIELSAVGDISGGVLAHEVGHNMELLHAPCRVPNPDPRYPYRGGIIGQWGIDLENMRLKRPDRHSDFMGYCSTVWVSDYHFEKAMATRRYKRQYAARPVLLVWGSITDREFEPAFYLSASATPAVPDGSYVAEGYDATGRVFTHRFNPLETSEGDQDFILTIPFDQGGSLTSITVRGPDMTMTLTDGAVPRMLIERNTRGQVIAIRRDYTGAAGSPGNLVSTGIPDLTLRRE